MKKSVVTLSVNGAEHELLIAPNKVLLEVLREALQLTGPPGVLSESIAMEFTLPAIVVGMDGTVLYRSAGEGSLSGSFELVWVDRAGNETEVDPSGQINPALTGGLRLSPDGSRVAFDQINDQGSSDIFVKRLPDGPPTRITFVDGFARRPVWK